MAAAIAFDPPRSLPFSFSAPKPISQTCLSFTHQHPTSLTSLLSGPLGRSRLAAARPRPPALLTAGSKNNDHGNGCHNGGGGGGGGGNGGGSGGGDESDGGWSEGFSGKAAVVLAQAERFLTTDMVTVEGSQGFRESFFADDLFLTKFTVECSVGVMAKIASEYEKRGVNFVNEIAIMVPDVVTGIVADFMLAYLSASTISLQPPLRTNATFIASLSQIALGTRSYLFVDRLHKIAKTGKKLFTVGTSTSLVGTAVPNALITEVIVKQLDDKVEDIPAVSTPDKVKEKHWSSYLEMGAELSAGLIPLDSMTRGWFREMPSSAVIARASAFWSRYSSGQS